jgi:hypothetical protein
LEAAQVNSHSSTCKSQSLFESPHEPGLTGYSLSSRIAPTTSLLQPQIEQKEQQIAPAASLLQPQTEQKGDQIAPTTSLLQPQTEQKEEQIAPTTFPLRVQTELKEQQVEMKPASPDSACEYAIRWDTEAVGTPNSMYPVVNRLSQCIQFRSLLA